MSHRLSDWPDEKGKMEQMQMQRNQNLLSRMPLKKLLYDWARIHSFKYKKSFMSKPKQLKTAMKLPPLISSRRNTYYHFQQFAVLFFLMLITLGMGSAVNLSAFIAIQMLPIQIYHHHYS